MTNIEKAQKQRQEIALQKLVNTTEYGILTKANFMERLFKDGAKHRSELGHPFTWSRTKYNRMDCPQQAEYEKKYDQKVLKYYIQLPNRASFYEVSKSEYNYFNQLVEESENDPQNIDPIVQSLFKAGGTLAGNPNKQLNLF